MSRSPACPPSPTPRCPPTCARGSAAATSRPTRPRSASSRCSSTSSSSRWPTRREPDSALDRGPATPRQHAGRAARRRSIAGGGLGLARSSTRGSQERRREHRCSRPSCSSTWTRRSPPPAGCSRSCSPRARRSARATSTRVLARLADDPDRDGPPRRARAGPRRAAAARRRRRSACPPTAGHARAPVHARRRPAPPRPPASAPPSCAACSPRSPASTASTAR